MRDQSENLRAMLPVVALGIVGGMRSQLPYALLSATTHPSDPALLRHTSVRKMLVLGSAFELVVDKLPFVPSRLNRASLIGRAVFGLTAGAWFAHRRKQSRLSGAVTGCAGAIAGSFAGYHGRYQLGQVTGLPDPVWALVEDGVAIALGLAVLSNRSNIQSKVVATKRSR